MEGCWNKNNMKWEHVRKEHMIHKTRCNTKNKQRLMHGVEEVVSLVAGRRDEVWGKKKKTNLDRSGNAVLCGPL